jgi:hypothetical protein
MPIYLGNTEIGAEYVDSYQLGNIYLGSNLVQQGERYTIPVTYLVLGGGGGGGAINAGGGGGSIGHLHARHSVLRGLL